MQDDDSFSQLSGCSQSVSAAAAVMKLLKIGVAMSNYTQVKKKCCKTCLHRTCLIVHLFGEAWAGVKWVG